MAVEDYWNFQKHYWKHHEWQCQFQIFWWYLVNWLVDWKMNLALDWKMNLTFY